MSAPTASSVTMTLTRFDNLAREAVKTNQPHRFMEEHWPAIVSLVILLPTMWSIDSMLI